MYVDRSRRRFLAGSTALAFTLATRLDPGLRAEPLPEVIVYKSPT